MSPLTAQRLIAMPFLVLGAWCLLFTQMVERLGFRPEYYHGTATTALMIGCFGAQAMLAGLFAAFSRFTRTTFLAYGLALLLLLVQLLVRVRRADVQRVDGDRFRRQPGDACAVRGRLPGIVIACAGSRPGVKQATDRRGIAI